MSRNMTSAAPVAGELLGDAVAAVLAAAGQVRGRVGVPRPAGLTERIFRKLGVSTRAAATVLALQYGLFDDTTWAK